MAHEGHSSTRTLARNTRTAQGGNPGWSARRLIHLGFALFLGRSACRLIPPLGEISGGNPGRSAKRLIPPRVCLASGEEREALDSTSGEISGETRGGARCAWSHLGFIVHYLLTWLFCRVLLRVPPLRAWWVIISCQSYTVSVFRLLKWLLTHGQHDAGCRMVRRFGGRTKRGLVASRNPCGSRCRAEPLRHLPTCAKCPV
jgi:hypothetical protein